MFNVDDQKDHLNHSPGRGRHRRGREQCRGSCRQPPEQVIRGQD